MTTSLGTFVLQDVTLTFVDAPGKRVTVAAVCPLCRWSASFTGDDAPDVAPSLARLVAEHQRNIHPPT